MEGQDIVREPGAITVRTVRVLNLLSSSDSSDEGYAYHGPPSKRKDIVAWRELDRCHERGASDTAKYLVVGAIVGES